MAYDDEKHLKDQREYEQHVRLRDWLHAQPAEDVAVEAAAHETRGEAPLTEPDPPLTEEGTQ